MKTISFIIASSVLFFAACENKTKNGKPLDTATSGEINICVDESFKPIVETQIATFESLYPKTKINATYIPETDAFKQLLLDSARIIFATRDLNTEEKAYFKKITITPTLIKIAVDAVALIVNPERNDSTLKYEQVLDILSGKITNWNQLNSKNKDEKINVVFDNKNSSTARFLKEDINKGKDFPANCFASNSNPEVIDYISKNVNAIGVIGLSWISDGDDPVSADLKKKIKVFGISSKTGGDGEFYEPYQAYISLGQYPLCRELYIVSREARVGLGTGFASFVAGDKGQRIILKSGLLPATMPVRIVGFKNNE